MILSAMAPEMGRIRKGTCLDFNAVHRTNRQQVHPTRAIAYQTCAGASNSPDRMMYCTRFGMKEPSM